MGMNRVKIAIVIALADHGGSLSTPGLVAALGGEVAPTTISRNLQELEGYGYVTGHLPPDGRRRRRTVWTLHHHRLHSDLRALIDATTPVSEPTTD